MLFLYFPGAQNRPGQNGRETAGTPASGIQVSLRAASILIVLITFDDSAVDDGLARLESLELFTTAANLVQVDPRDAVPFATDFLESGFAPGFVSGFGGFAGCSGFDSAEDSAVGGLGVADSSFFASPLDCGPTAGTVTASGTGAAFTSGSFDSFFGADMSLSSEA